VDLENACEKRGYAYLRILSPKMQNTFVFTWLCWRAFALRYSWIQSANLHLHCAVRDSLMGLWPRSPLACSINMWGGARGVSSHHDRNPSRHFPRVWHQNPSRAQGASTPAHDVLSPVRVDSVGCCCADWLRWSGAAAGMSTRRMRSWSTTSILTRDYIGWLLKLFFYCTTRVVRMMHNPLLTSFLGDTIKIVLV
jgi:hypothetical protein